MEYITVPISSLPLITDPWLQWSQGSRGLPHINPEFIVAITAGKAVKPAFRVKHTFDVESCNSC